MLTPEKFLDTQYVEDTIVYCGDTGKDAYLSHLLKVFTKELIQSIIDDLEANRNKNAVDYLKSKL